MAAACGSADGGPTDEQAAPQQPRLQSRTIVDPIDGPAGGPVDGSAEAADPAPTDGGDGGAGESGSGPLPRFPVQPAHWAGCGDGFECATVAVPLDHDDPSGPTIDLGLIRVPAADRDGSGVTGSILVNPGGPGGSGVDFVRGGFRLDPATMDDHHLVGFDPRGVGASAALDCSLDDGGGPLPDFDPDDDQERAELDQRAREAANRCQNRAGDLLPHVATTNVVQDLDLLREAVGDERLRYMGFSYGTLLGLRYAERFPELVDRLILDGVVDPSHTLDDLLSQQADGFDQNFAAIDQACGTRLDCPSGGIAATYDRVHQRLDSDGPIDDIGPSELAIGVLLSLYDESFWPVAAEALTSADGGDVAGLQRLYRLYQNSAEQSAYLAVVCTDGPVPRGADEWDRLEERLAARSPRFGAVLANEVRACAHWPAVSALEPAAISPPGLGPVLILSTTGDAATPLENAEAVADRLERSALVTVDDRGHTAYGRNECVDQAVAAYLADAAAASSLRC